MQINLDLKSYASCFNVQFPENPHECCNDAQEKTDKQQDQDEGCSLDSSSAERPLSHTVAARKRATMHSARKFPL